MTLPESIANDPKYAKRLLEIAEEKDIPKEWQGTPIESLILAHNFQKPITEVGKPKLLIAACIEFRYSLPVPRMYAYVIRRASGRLVGSEFSLAYVFAQGVKHIALIGHNDCGMTQVHANTPAMIEALIKQGWHKDRAEEYIRYQAARYSIEDEIDALKYEYIRLKRLFRDVCIAPFIVCLDNTNLYLPKWYEEIKDDPTIERNKVADEELLTLF
jgi:carbonic anhydrase